jgi:hypothetical protein
MRAQVLLLATLLAAGAYAANVCRDTAACCFTVNMLYERWADGADVASLSAAGVQPWATQGVVFSVTQKPSGSTVPYTLGVFNVSNTALGPGSTLVGAKQLMGPASAADGYVLSAFKTYPGELLRYAQTLHIGLAKQPACVSHLRVLRSMSFDWRQAVRLDLLRRTAPNATTMVSVYTTQTTYQADPRYPVVQANDYEFTLTAIDDVKVDFYGQGYGAISSIEVCSMVGYDACGVCNGDGSTCTGVPGAPCQTGMSGWCAAGTYDADMMCIPNHHNEVELCNGLDDNCNGQIDEGDWGLTPPCGNGICQRQYSLCIDGAPNTRCEPAPIAVPEVCGDGLDNDCDGVVDNGCPVVTTASRTPSSTSAPSQSQTATPSSSSAPTQSQSPSQPPTQSQSPSPPPTPPPTPSSSPLPRMGTAYLVPQLVCVRPVDAVSGAMQAVFTYAYVSQTTEPLFVPLGLDVGRNWLSAASGVQVAQTQPASFTPNSTGLVRFNAVFLRTDELHWTLQAPPNAVAPLGTRQVAVANQYSVQCNSDAPSTLDAVQPLLSGCVVQTQGSQCSALLGYYNPNAQTVQLDVAPGQNEFVASAGGQVLPSAQQTPDRRQPRVCWPGLVPQAVQVDFECSSNLWALEWALTTAGTTRRLRLDQSSVC